MTIDNLIITQAGFFSQRWNIVLENIEIVSDKETNIPIHSGCLVWIFSGRSDWDKICKHHCENNHKVIIFTHSPDLKELHSALKSGAKGYISSMSNPDTVARVASSVQNGAIWIPGSLISRIINLIPQQKIKAPSQNFSEILTSREWDISQLVSQGMNNKAIANELDITERTVKSHLTNAYEKLNVKDRLQLSLKIRNAM
jgi:DNA-binding NarL/FixJ family response regulator